MAGCLFGTLWYCTVCVCVCVSDTVSHVCSGTVTVSLCNSSRVITWKSHTTHHVRNILQLCFRFVYFQNSWYGKFCIQRSFFISQLVSLIETQKKFTFVGVKFGFSIPDHLKGWFLVSLILKGIPLGPSLDLKFHRTTYCTLPVFNVSNTDGPKACCCCSTCCGCFIIMVPILLFLNVVLFCKADLNL